ncbi:unnamed protein product [Rhizophagus irregularis]|nr:unnamed protein product [Rhizophagus irregularis]
MKELYIATCILETSARIAQGLRETIVPGTPGNYVELYVECWNSEPDNRPTINDVVARLKNIINTSDNAKIIYEPTFSSSTHISINNSLVGDKCFTRRRGSEYNN